MSIQAISDFFEKLDQDVGFSESLTALKEGTPDDIVAFASKAGFEFTSEELLGVSKAIHAARELTDEEMESVTGGLSFATSTYSPSTLSSYTTLRSYTTLSSPTLGSTLVTNLGGLTSPGGTVMM